MHNKTPLSVRMESARGMLIQAFNQIQEETGLPAYLYEGMIVNLLAEVRNQKNLEILADLNAAEAAEKKEPTKKGE